MMMTPLSLEIDRNFPGIGRLKKATGSTSPRIRARLNDMLDELYRGETQRHDIIRAIKNDELKLLQVYDAYRKHALHKLPLGLTGKPLADALLEWIDGLVPGVDYSKEYISTLRTTQRYFAKARPGARVMDVAELLEELRDTPLGVETPRSFNLARSHAMAFIRAKLKRNHPVWLAIAAVDKRKVEKKDPRPLLSPDQARELFPHPDTDRLDRVAWVMLTTGMHAKEYWGEWSNEPTCIRVHGTKRKGRDRRVPLVRLAIQPPWKHRRNFEDAFRERAPHLVPYDLRRTYGHWMELAQIPRTRRRMYLGHGAGDVTDLYEQHEVTAFLAEDADKLRAFLKLDPPKLELRVEQGGAA